MNAKQFSRISKAVSDSKRYKMLTRIAAKPGEITCTDVRSGLGISAATCSHHVKELLEAGLIAVRREGKFGYIKLHKRTWREYLAQLGKLR